MANICFIPARKNSTRLKNKNIAPFGNGNLVTYTIQQAIDSDIFDRIILSSDDRDILDMAYGYEIETDDDDDELAGSYIADWMIERLMK